MAIKINELVVGQEPVERVAVITLRAQKNQERKKVVWTDDTVDNEHMNKKKSKCCCIYTKPTKFGESDSDSSDDDDDCEHCFGHVEKRKTKHGGTQLEPDGSTNTTTIQENPEPKEVTATITLKSNELEPAAPTPPDKGDHNQQ